MGVGPDHDRLLDRTRGSGIPYRDSELWPMRSVSRCGGRLIGLAMGFAHHHRRSVARSTGEHEK
jgi:hypothetical protein